MISQQDIMTKVKPIYHVLFWVFIFFFVLDYLVSEYEITQAISLTLIEVAIYALIFYLNFYILIPKLFIDKGKMAYALGLFFVLALISMGMYVTELGYYLIGEEPIRNTLSFSLNYILFIVISFLYWYFALYQKEKQNALALQNEKLQAELLLLKSQVSPHFLFNSLNNIYSLSVVKDDNASLMIEKLSDILRYIIYEGNNEYVLLQREVELLNNYIELHLLKKLKGGKNINVSTKGVTSLHKVAPLLLINSMENCFKHGDIGYNENGFLNVDLIVENEILHFTAENSFQQKEVKEGIGLKNMKAQLQHYYPEKHTLNIENTEGVFKVNLQIELN